MKKIFSLFLAVLLLLTLVACGDEGTTKKKKSDDTEEETQEVTETETKTEEKTEAETEPKPETEEEENWAKSIRKSDFDNVTIEMECVFISGYEYEDESTCTVKIADGKFEVDGMLMDDEDSIDLLNDAYLGTFFEIIENSDKFQFDEDSNCYVSTEDITFTVTYTGVDVEIKLEKGETLAAVKSNGKMAGIATCMTQSFSSEGEDIEYVLEVYFTFSDYGTTTID